MALLSITPAKEGRTPSDSPFGFPLVFKACETLRGFMSFVCGRLRSLQSYTLSKTLVFTFLPYERQRAQSLSLILLYRLSCFVNQRDSKGRVGRSPSPFGSVIDKSVESRSCPPSAQDKTPPSAQDKTPPSAQDKTPPSAQGVRLLAVGRGYKVENADAFSNYFYVLCGQHTRGPALALL